MKYFQIGLYLVALMIQVGTVIQCFATLKHVGKMRTGWALLGTAFAVVLIHRLYALLMIHGDQIAHLIDGLFSVLVSGFFFIGIFFIRRIAAEQKKVNLELVQINQYDSLTHAFSRAETIHRLENEIERSQRFIHSLAVLEIDIDHFKRVNDTYGHQVGDELLKSLTQCCLSVLRLNDSFGRIGGEEFLIILPETNQSQAMEAAERIRQVVASTMHQTSISDPLHITVSVGLTTFDPLKNDETDHYLIMQSLMNRADQAMYQAKAAGRNRVICWGKADN